MTHSKTSISKIPACNRRGGDRVYYFAKQRKAKNEKENRLVPFRRDGEGVSTYPLDPSGSTTIPATATPARFFRLRVTER